MPRAFLGVKNRLAMEFTGYTGSQSQFIYAYRRGKATPAAKHHHYTPAQIRQIRLELAGQVEPSQRPKKLPPIICARMTKGGVGKTTVSGNVASALALMGYRVLMIDGDPQASLSLLFGVNWAKQPVTHIAEIMRRCQQRQPTRIEEAVIPIYDGGMLDLIPSSVEMSNADLWLVGTMNREQAFIKLLQSEAEFFSRYDVIMLDSAPATSQLTMAFMVAAPQMITIVTPEAQATGALPQLESNLQELNDNFPGRNYRTHLIVNRYNQGKAPHQAELQALIEQHADILDNTIVRDFVGFLRGLDDPEDAHGPILEREPNSIGARDIIELAKSLAALYALSLNGVVAQEAAA